jgi:hypothetical protein
LGLCGGLLLLSLLLFVLIALCWIIPKPRMRFNHATPPLLGRRKCRPNFRTDFWFPKVRCESFRRTFVKQKSNGELGESSGSAWALLELIWGLFEPRGILGLWISAYVVSLCKLGGAVCLLNDVLGRAPSEFDVVN